MRFTIKREEFLKGLLVAGRAVGNKTANPVLANLRLELNENGLFITGSNSDLTIKTQVPYRFNGVEIIRNFKEGGTLINAKLIMEIARKMESEEISLDVIDSTIATVSGIIVHRSTTVITIHSYFLLLPVFSCVIHIVYRFNIAHK